MYGMDTVDFFVSEEHVEPAWLHYGVKIFIKCLPHTRAHLHIASTHTRAFPNILNPKKIKHYDLTRFSRH